MLVSIEKLHACKAELIVCTPVLWLQGRDATWSSISAPWMSGKSSGDATAYNRELAQDAWASLGVCAVAPAKTSAHRLLPWLVDMLAYDEPTCIIFAKHPA